LATKQYTFKPISASPSSRHKASSYACVQSFSMVKIFQCILLTSRSNTLTNMWQQ